MNQRPFPYVWVTWLTGLLSGDKHCRYALWVKARHKFEKRAESDESLARLSRWTGEHADAVHARAEALRADGYAVRLEDANKFKVHGKYADLSGCADIVATRGDEAVIEDAKTGKRRESDWWQVVVYMHFLPLALRETFDGKQVCGSVVYGDGVRPVFPDDVGAASMSRIVGLIRMASAGDPPPAEPSARECGFCNIAECQYRVPDEADAVAETEAF